MARPKNFDKGIHDEAYLDPFQEGLLTSESLVNDFGRPIELLNGRWSFTVDPYDTCLRGDWWTERDRDARGAFFPLDYCFDSWELADVPSCFNLQKPEYFWYEGPAVYTREFICYEEAGRERVYLKVGAVNYEAFIFINRRFVGRHLGGSTPMFVDVTDFLNQELGNETNRVLIVANNDRKPTQLPMHNTDWFNYGGLYRDVGLIRLPKTFIDDTFLGLQKGSDFKKIDVEVSVDGPEQNGTATVKIPELGIFQSLEIKEGEHRARCRAGAVEPGQPEALRGGHLLWKRHADRKDRVPRNFHLRHRYPAQRQARQAQGNLLPRGERRRRQDHDRGGNPSAVRAEPIRISTTFTIGKDCWTRRKRTGSWPSMY